MNLVITPEALDELADYFYMERCGGSASSRPDYRFIVIRRRSRGRGHVAVYTVGESRVAVIPVFHTAQDWQASVAEG